MLVQLKSLFKYCQGVAHIWDVHEIGLARQERALQDKLDACRHGHDNQNQVIVIVQSTHPTEGIVKQTWSYT